jgi:hypothetical protein
MEDGGWKMAEDGNRDIRRDLRPSSIFHPPSSYFVVLLLAALALTAPADEPPTIPIGLDAYRQWERWPVQRIGARAYMRSTYDRRGGNETADASHFLYQRADDDNVTLDLEGPGVLYFARYNHWHGSPWRYVVDGAEHIVRETSTKDPTKPVEGSVFEPRELFPPVLTYTWSTTKGADLMWLPIGFDRSFRMGYSRTCYGTGYYIYHRYVGGAKLSRSIEAWAGKTPPDAADVIALLEKSGSNLAPPSAAPVSQRISFTGDHRAQYVQITQAPAAVRAIEISAPRDKAIGLAKLRITATWDDRPTPSIDAPLPLFFGTGTLYNRDGREYLVKALPVNVRFSEDRVHLACYFPMPFFRSAKIGLVATEAVDIPDVGITVRLTPMTEAPNHVAYFHASYKDHGPNPPRGGDLVLLDTRDAEGGGDWTGSFVGTSFIFTKNNVLTTLEGDPRFYFDDSMSPQAQGTGTEEWGGGGDYWGGRNMTLPLAGHPVGAANAKEVKGDLDKIHSAYRFLLADLFPFGKNARITLEHGGTNTSTEHYETIAYWYGLPGASAVKTDELKVGDAASERAHRYRSPQASEPYRIASRYEWGVDSLDKREVYARHEDVGRTTTGTSEFVVKLEPNNFGALLRRKLDYQYPNQRAEVFVADASDPSKSPADADFKPAGVWYLAGSNTCVFSRPPKELDPPLHIVQTSNRRFRDDEFLISRELTAGRSAIAVRVTFTPVDRPLFPGKAFPETPAWSEIRYDAYCFVMPKFKH